MKRGLIKIAAVALTAAMAGVSAGAGETEEQARAILDKNKEAVVTLQLVIEMNISGMGPSQGQETRSEATATVISPDGLAVTALSSTDPMGMVQNMMGGMGGMMGQMKMSSEVTDAKYLMPDDSEVPVKVVLRDKDLDLAFIRPREPLEEPMTYVDLSKNSDAELLDQLVTINRLGKVAQRTYSVSFERVQAMVEKPRKFYIPGAQPTRTGVGSPAFTQDGKVVGIIVLRSTRASDSGGGFGSMLGMMGGDAPVTPIILPAADIAEISKQAPTPEEAQDEPAE